MKTLLITLTLLVGLLTTTYAQTEKGRWTVGGQVGNLLYQGTTSNQTIAVLLSPSAGYFVAKNLAVGLSVPVLYQNVTSKSSNGDFGISFTQVGLTPFVRFYLGDAKLRPFLNASGGYNISRTSFSSSSQFPITNNSPNDDFWGYSVGAGVAYFINNSLSFDGLVSYTDGRATLADLVYSTTRQRTFGVSVGFRLFLGK
jgi:outer membrane protein W